MALLNRGLPGNNVADGTHDALAAAQHADRGLRIRRRLRAGHVVGFTGFELGKELTFDYALVPHAGDWRQAGVYRDGLEFNQPLLACTRGPAPGRAAQALGARWKSPRTTSSLTALKPGPDGTAVLRVYEADGQADPGDDPAVGPGRSRPRK